MSNLITGQGAAQAGGAMTKGSAAGATMGNIMNLGSMAAGAGAFDGLGGKIKGMFAGGGGGIPMNPNLANNTDYRQFGSF